MRVVIAPSMLGGSSGEASVADISLGGVFYDYLRTADGSNVGVRYHVSEEVIFSDHPVFKQFLTDRRFSFCAGEHVDMVFHDRDADALQRGELNIFVAQDFGGESVIRQEGGLSIAFEIRDEPIS